MWAITLISIEQHPEVKQFMSYDAQVRKSFVTATKNHIEAILEICPLTGCSIRLLQKCYNNFSLCFIAILVQFLMAS